MNYQPFTVKKKKSSLYVELWLHFGWECNKDKTCFPVENSVQETWSKYVRRKRWSCCRKPEFSYIWHTNAPKTPCQRHRWEIFAANFCFKLFSDGWPNVFPLRCSVISIKHINTNVSFWASFREKHYQTIITTQTNTNTVQTLMEQITVEFF